MSRTRTSRLKRRFKGWWAEERGLNTIVSVYTEREKYPCLSYARQFACPLCGGGMLERLADCPAQVDMWPDQRTWVIDAWCEECHDVRSWETEPYPNFKHTFSEKYIQGGLKHSYESLITMTSLLIWGVGTLPMWERQDQYRKKGEVVSTKYPTLHQAMSARSQEHVRLSKTQRKSGVQPSTVSAQNYL